MSYPVTLNEEDFELFRIARLLDKQKVLELLKIVRSKRVSIDDLLSFVKGGVKTEERGLNKEALSFILRLVVKKFPDVTIPPELTVYVPSVKLGEKTKEVKREVARRAKAGETTPQTDYMLPILEALIEMGGSGRMRDVLDRVFTKIKNQLKPKDMEKLPSGTAIRWKNKAQWERQRLKSEGYLKKDSPHGTWEITDEGRKLYEKLKQRK